MLLNKHFGSVRFIYNWALEYSQKKYKTDGKYLGWMSIATSQDFKNLKTENSWLSEINSQSICNSIAHLGRGFKNFFDGRSGFPKFKSRHDNHQSFEIPAGLKIDFQKKKIQIPKFLKTKTEDNRIKFVLSRRVNLEQQLFQEILQGNILLALSSIRMNKSKLQFQTRR